MGENNLEKAKLTIRKLIDLKELSDAKALAIDYVRINQEDPDGYLLLGEILALQQKYSEASEILEKGVIRDFKNSYIHNGLGVVYRQLGDYISSLIHFYQAKRYSNDLELTEFAEENINEVSKFLSNEEKTNIIQALEK